MSSKRLTDLIDATDAQIEQINENLASLEVERSNAMQTVNAITSSMNRLQREKKVLIKSLRELRNGDQERDDLSADQESAELQSSGAEVSPEIGH